MKRLDAVLPPRTAHANQFGGAQRVDMFSERARLHGRRVRDDGLRGGRFGGDDEGQEALQVGRESSDSGPERFVDARRGERR